MTIRFYKFMTRPRFGLVGHATGTRLVYAEVSDSGSLYLSREDGTNIDLSIVFQETQRLLFVLEDMVRSHLPAWQVESVLNSFDPPDGEDGWHVLETPLIRPTQ